MTLAEWMEANEVSDEQLAETLGLDRSTVSRIRRAKWVPSSSTIAAIVKASGGKVEAGSFFRPPYLVAESAA